MGNDSQTQNHNRQKPWPYLTTDHVSGIFSEQFLTEYEAQKDLLFCEDEDVDVDVIERHETEVKKYKLKTTNDILNYCKTECQNYDSQSSLLRIVVIHQSYSWGKLWISSSGLQSLFGQLSVSNTLWQTLRLFGHKSDPDHEFQGGLMQTRTPGTQDFEVSFIAKHAAINGRPDAFDPWSVRNIGVYHQISAGGRIEKFILINPPQVMVDVIKGQSRLSSTDVYRLLAAISGDCWTQYLLYLESLYRKISKKALLCRAPKSETVSFELQVHFPDSQYLQKLQGILAQVSHVLTLNLSIWEALPQSLQGVSSDDAFQDLDFALAVDTCLRQTTTNRAHAKNILSRLEGTSMLVQSILNAQVLEELRRSGRTTADLATIACEDSKQVFKSARTLNTITILGFVYLPASFVASLLGTEYIQLKLDDMSSKYLVEILPGIWIFLVLTAALLIITGLAWAILERKSARSDQTSMHDQCNKRKV